MNLVATGDYDGSPVGALPFDTISPILAIPIVGLAIDGSRECVATIAVQIEILVASVGPHLAAINDGFDNAALQKEGLQF
jgi:hypothetical protein